MSEMVYLEHAETGGSQHVADDEAVLAHFKARGWERAEEPAAQGMVLPPTSAPVEGEEWVDMYHPDLPLGHQRLPNDPAAIAAQKENGWTTERPDPRTDSEREADENAAAARQAAKKKAPASADATDEPSATAKTKE